jgi:hypothetical protein
MRRGLLRLRCTEQEVLQLAADAYYMKATDCGGHGDSVVECVAKEGVKSVLESRWSKCKAGALDINLTPPGTQYGARQCNPERKSTLETRRLQLSAHQPYLR